MDVKYYTWKNYHTIGPDNLLKRYDGITFPWDPTLHHVHLANPPRVFVRHPNENNNAALVKRYAANPIPLQQLLIDHELPGNAVRILDETSWPELTIEQQSCFVHHLFATYAVEKHESLMKAVNAYHKRQPPLEPLCAF